MELFFSGMHVVGRIASVCFVIALALVIVGCLIGCVIYVFGKVFKWFTDDGLDKKTPADRWFEAHFGGEYWEDTAVRNMCPTRSCNTCTEPELCTCRKCGTCDRGERLIVCQVAGNGGEG